MCCTGHGFYVISGAWSAPPWIGFVRQSFDQKARRSAREVNRFLKAWTQTLLAPLLTSALYVVVFGYGLGSRIREVEGVPYLEFILPGLILLAVITASYGNTSSSVFAALAFLGTVEILRRGWKLRY